MISISPRCSSRCVAINLDGCIHALKRRKYLAESEHVGKSQLDNRFISKCLNFQASKMLSRRLASAHGSKPAFKVSEKGTDLFSVICCPVTGSARPIVQGHRPPARLYSSSGRRLAVPSRCPCERHIHRHAAGLIHAGAIDGAVAIDRCLCASTQRDNSNRHWPIFA